VRTINLCHQWCWNAAVESWNCRFENLRQLWHRFPIGVNPKDHVGINSLYNLWMHLQGVHYLSIQKSTPCSVFCLVLAKKWCLWHGLRWLMHHCLYRGSTRVVGEPKELWCLFGQMPLVEHAMLFPSGRVHFALEVRWCESIKARTRIFLLSLIFYMGSSK
jgi:hypothetical protein